MAKFLVSARNAKGKLLDAEVAHTLLKAEEAGARMIYDLTDDLFGTKSRQQQNEALLFDGSKALVINVDQCAVHMEPLLEK